MVVWVDIVKIAACNITYVCMYVCMYRIAGIIRGGLIFAVFAVDKHPRKLNPRIITLELSVKKTCVPSAHCVATVLQANN